jgi:tetratricopeptide (TPR) repeat protein
VSLKRKFKRQAMRAPSGKIMRRLDEAEKLMDRGRFYEARELLRELDREFPNRPEILTELCNANIGLNDMFNLQFVCERLHRLTPNDPFVLNNLGAAYVFSMRPALAARAFREFARRFPRHEDATKKLEQAEVLEEELKKMVADSVIADREDYFELAVLHEEAQVFMESAQYEKARKAAEELLKRAPNFAPARNNLGMVLSFMGDVNEAARQAEKVLEQDPDNHHANANLTRYLFLSGRFDEATQQAERLKAIPQKNTETCLKQAEALNFIGDDKGVLEVFQRAKDSGLLDDEEDNPAFLYHLAGVSAYRLGKQSEARRLWDEALEIDSDFDMTLENLEDLGQPVGKRNGPWAFGFRYWVSDKIIKDLSELSVKAARSGDDIDAKTTKSLQRYFEEHHELEKLLPAMLARGDKEARTFALMVAKMVETKASLEALREFALSKNGTDEMRQKALLALQAKNLIEGNVEMWVKGEWQELMTMSYEITGEPILGDHSPEVRELLEEGYHANRSRNFKRAEECFKKALELEPDSPTIMNNLAVVYGQTGREEEAKKISMEIYERFPDYIFGAMTAARIKIAEGKIKEAEEILKRFSTKRKFHFSEFATYVSTHIELCLARKDKEGARRWLDTWADMDEDCDVDYWKSRIEGKDRKLDLNLLKKALGFGR